MVRRLPLLVLLAAGACTFPEQSLPPGERAIVVHAVLDPTHSLQTINLSMTDGSEVTPGAFDQADVSITTPDGTRYTARQDSLRDSTGKLIVTRPLYRAALPALVPGGTYQLRFQDRFGAVITGQTTVPSATPTSSVESRDFARLSDTLKLSWNRVPGARTYEVQVWVTEMFDGGSQGKFGFIRLQYTAFRDSSLTLAGTARTADDDDIFPRVLAKNHTVTASVFVYAVDDNYYQYYRLLGDPFIGAAPSRLTGGLGVFGAIVPIEKLVLTVK